MKLSPIQIEQLVSSTSQGRPIAFVEQPALNETQLVLTRALELLGPNGENWMAGTYCNNSHDQFCSIGAVTVAKYGNASGNDGSEDGGNSYVKLTEDWLVEVGNPLAAAIGTGNFYGSCLGRVTKFNDRATFSEVRDMFLRAISLAGEIQK